MKHLSKFLLGLAAFGLVACSNDEPANNNKSEGDVYASLTIQLPTAAGTRSGTLEDGFEDKDSQSGQTNSNGLYEIGQDYENTVSSVFVVIVDENMKYLNSSLSSSAAPGAASDPTYTLAFKADELINLAGKDVSVITFCNPTQDIIDATEKLSEGQDFNIDLTYSLKNNINEITGKNNFLMVSRNLINIADKELKSKISIPSKESLLQNNNTPQTAFNLGTYRVDRVVSRFDFMEGVTGSKYAILDTKDNETVVGYVVLDGMAVINQAKEFYYLPRVSDNGMNGTNVDGWKLFGNETKYNFVVSPNDDAKILANGNTASLSGNYNNPIVLADGTPVHASTYTYTPISTILGNDVNNYESWDETEKLNYHIWCYTTENTIPTVDAQRHGISTGVVFKGHIEPVAGSPVEEAMNKRDVIYTYNDILYGNLEALKKAVAAAPVSALSAAYNATFVGDNIDAKGDLTAEIAGDFVAYHPDQNGKYNVYYYYYNRHNDNGIPTTMGPMEFATVRNNVYKLKVTKISKFGRPTDNPDIPDEDPKAYFEVSCKVMPWVVRINNIEF